MLVNRGLLITSRARGEFRATVAGSNLPETSENSLYKHHAKVQKILGNMATVTRTLVAGMASHK
jgi:hypothetical protein